MTPDYLDALDTSHRISHRAVLQRHDTHDAGLAKLRDELVAVNLRLDAIIKASSQRENKLEGTRLWRMLRWLRLI